MLAVGGEFGTLGGIGMLRGGKKAAPADVPAAAGGSLLSLWVAY
jgi:hypothetical protein